MKTIEELYKEVIANDELKKEFLLLKGEGVEEFAAKHGCKATEDEIKDFLSEKKNSEGELSEEELDQIAGGKCLSVDELFASICTVGIACAGLAVVSVAFGKSGTAIDDDINKVFCHID